MARRAIIVSDLHLAAHPLLDDFVHDDEFAAMLAAPELQPDGADVDLVLLGDTFDLWQSIGEAEAIASKSIDIPLDEVGGAEAKRLDEIRARHGRWFEALAAHLEKDRTRVVVVPGNHDRALVDAAVQDALTRHLGVPAGSPRLAFQDFYEERSLRLYADHGSQYDRNNVVEPFSLLDGGRESAGYYFVKLFLNRLEHRDPRIENSPSGWAGLWHWLRRIANLPLVAAAIRWFWQYWWDPRVPEHVGVAQAQGAESSVAPPSAPLLLVAGCAPAEVQAGGAFFSADPEMEDFFRAAYGQSEEVRIAVNEILEARAEASPQNRRSSEDAATRRARLAQPRGEVPRPTLSRPVPAARAEKGAGPPRDVAWAERTFDDGPCFRAPLNREEFDVVVFGHTHDELTWRLQNDAIYLNAGTWAVDRGPLPLVVAEPGGNARLAYVEGARVI